MIEIIIHDDGTLKIVMITNDSKNFKFDVRNKYDKSCFMISKDTPQLFDTVIEAVEAYNLIA